MASASCGRAGGAGPGPARPAAKVTISLRAFVSKVAAQGSGLPASSASAKLARFEDIEHYSFVQDAGSNDSFTLFATSIRYAVVSPGSSAMVEVRELGPAHFASSLNAQAWRMAGSPPLPDRRTTTGYQSFPVGQFSFLPQGTTLTYEQARNMPARPPGVMAIVRSHLRPYAGTRPPAELILKQLGFLLASAPLSGPARQAAWMALAGLPGARLCGAGTDLLGRHGESVCAGVPTEEIEVLIRPATGQVLAVMQRVLRPTPLFPNIAAGTVVESDTFLPIKH